MESTLFFEISCSIVKNHNGNGVKVRQIQREVKNHIGNGVKVRQLQRQAARLAHQNGCITTAIGRRGTSSPQKRALVVLVVTGQDVGCKQPIS
jgi:L,D-peptidoglycan transpeptidase YkuD (ErfK/YbiS/YcfS/YnhG family)